MMRDFVSLRAATGLSVQELAEEFGRPLREVVDWDSGLISPPAEVLQSLAILSAYPDTGASPADVIPIFSSKNTEYEKRVGVTSDLAKRVWEHRNGLVPGFTRKYGCKLLVWYAAYDDLQEARLRELQMKKWKRLWKLSEIEQMNPDWRDLYPTLAEGASGA